MNYTTIILIFLLTSITYTAKGQEMPLLKNHNEQRLVYNPAFAGSEGHLTMNMSQKLQKTVANNAVVSQFFTIHAPIRYTKIGLGLSLIHQRRNNMSEVKIAGDYAYTIETSYNSKLSLGLSGVLNCCAKDFKSLKKLALSDEVTPNSQHGTLSGDAGVGIQYTSEYFWAGISMPSLLQPILNSNEKAINTPTTQGYYFTLGTDLPINQIYTIKVNCLVKGVNYTTNIDTRIGLEYDLNVKLMIYQALSVGISYRSSTEYGFDFLGQKSAGIDISYHFNNNTQLGLAFDKPFKSPADVSQNSIELIAAYSVPHKKETLLTPRYFF